jgi:ubiquinone/menaquinone biosynthesis C-methylase UbiE
MISERITAQMQTSVNDYQWLEGHRHVSDVPYMLPNDDSEIDRLDLQHYMLRYTLKGNYLAPITEPAHILDVGSGTGRWLTEMAQEFPQAELFGVDLSLPEEGKTIFPANCHFQKANALNGLPFEDNSFDFIHQRLLIFAIPRLRWQQLIDELVRVTAVGGWVELIEVNPFFNNMGPATKRLLDLIVRAALQRGLDPAISLRIGTLLETAGLTKVKASTHIIPLGRWGGRLGIMAITDVTAIARAMKPLVAAQTPTAPEDYDHLVIQMQQEVEQYRTIFTFHIAYGQRQ